MLLIFMFIFSLRLGRKPVVRALPRILQHHVDYFFIPRCTSHHKAHRYEPAELQTSLQGNYHQAFSEILLSVPRPRRRAAVWFCRSAVQHA